MSISLIGVMVGLPIALAMRGIMGKEKFEEWLESGNYILYTDFSNEDEMRRIVQGAGYDVTEWLGLLKTHLTESQTSYFLWEKIEGRIVAKMSVYDDKEAIKRFVSKVEQKAGRKVFWEQAQTAQSDDLRISGKNRGNLSSKEKSEMRNQIQKTEEKQKRQQYRERFPSVFVDSDLVLKILNQYKIKVLLFQENRIEAEYECYRMSFSRSSQEAPFDIDIISDSNTMKVLYSCLESINEEYYASIQEKTYLHIREQIEEEGLEIEDEQVLEDNSIVITVAV